ncbi:uncharacterized protein LOC126726169 [Quercus robur]|uniref:50S ribosomal protein L34 n=1 Tax=Quercus lobata TaxID=97700 RepID=A0A7N2LR54_QUELO|nr:uncharacterized protein LOC126726169 [Quercus robur]XP_050287255.1 uncharacterized protein LOC126726169 [Quercus robur]XP_050287256.1 uncharacterized protein LOC126726169 [Quercus robur]XP_050287257.1 uncharacterized protein LOC126726169 [Quercus robur]
MTSNSCCLLLNFPVQVRSLTNYTSNNKNFPFLRLTNPSSLRLQPPPISAPQSKATSAAMEADQSTTTNTSTSTSSSGSCPPMNLLFVEMGVGYDQHGQDITAAAMRACRDAISSNSIPAFRRGSIPGVTFDQMKLQIKLGVPHSLQQSLDIERVKSVFPYGKIVKFEVVDGGLICSSGVHVEEMGDKNDDCYIVNAAVYVGY